MNQGKLTQRNAVVTGGAQGIGFAIAQRLLDEGAHVALWDVDSQALAYASGQLPRMRRASPKCAYSGRLSSIS